MKEGTLFDYAVGWDFYMLTVIQCKNERRGLGKLLLRRKYYVELITDPAAGRSFRFLLLTLNERHKVDWKRVRAILGENARTALIQPDIRLTAAAGITPPDSAAFSIRLLYNAAQALFPAADATAVSVDSAASASADSATSASVDSAVSASADVSTANAGSQIDPNISHTRTSADAAFSAEGGHNPRGTTASQSPDTAPPIPHTANPLREDSFTSPITHIANSSQSLQSKPAPPIRRPVRVLLADENGSFPDFAQMLLARCGKLGVLTKNPETFQSLGEGISFSFPPQEATHIIAPHLTAWSCDALSDTSAPILSAVCEKGAVCGGTVLTNFTAALPREYAPYLPPKLDPAAFMAGLYACCRPNRLENLTPSCCDVQIGGKTALAQVDFRTCT